MNPQTKQIARSSRLPATPGALFWDHDFAALSCEDDCDLIMTRGLTSESWDTVIWLRSLTLGQAPRELLLEIGLGLRQSGAKVLINFREQVKR